MYFIKHGGLYLVGFDMYSTGWTANPDKATPYSFAEAQTVSYALNYGIVVREIEPS